MDIWDFNIVFQTTSTFVTSPSGGSQLHCLTDPIIRKSLVSFRDICLSVIFRCWSEINLKATAFQSQQESQDCSALDVHNHGKSLYHIRTHIS